MNPALKKTPRRAANRRTSATASGNRRRRNDHLLPPPHGAILPNERGTLPPLRLLPSKPGNINVYRVAVAEGMNCQGPTPNRKGVFQLYGVLPQLGQTMVLTSACPEQCACPARSGGGSHAQHQFNFAVQPPGGGFLQLVNAAAPQPPTIASPHPPNAVQLQPSDAVPLQPSSAKPRCPAVPEVSYADMVFEYVDEKLTEELENRLLSLERPNATKEDRFKDKNRIKWILEILEM